jgi:hypothetical protein
LGPIAAEQQPLHPVVALHAQWPAVHCVPAPHTTPQPPQLLLSVVSLTHAVPHGVSPAAHWHVSVVGLHVSPVTAEQRGVWFTKVPVALHVCTASPAGEHRLVLGAHVPVHPVGATHVWEIIVQFWLTTTPVALQLLLVFVVALHVTGPGAHIPAHPPLTTHVVFTHGCGAIGTPFGPQTTSELPVQVFVPGLHPHEPPPVVALQTRPAPHVPHAAPEAPQLVVDCAVNGSHAFWPVAAVQQPLQPVEALQAQWPPVHWVPAPHAMPQPPQLLLSVVSSTHAAPHGVCPVGHWHETVIGLHVSPAIAEQRGVTFTNVPDGSQVCTASPAGEHWLVFGAQLPVQPVPATHVLPKAVQGCVTTTPLLPQVLLVLVVALHVTGPGVHMPAHPPLTTQVELTQGCGCPGTPLGPQTTSELPVQVLVPGAHPHEPPPLVALQTWPAAHGPHEAPAAPQLAVDSAANGWQAFWPAAAVQHPLHPVAPLHVHTPPAHWVPIPQTIPHPPQLLLSVSSLTHRLPHWLKPVLHAIPQLPAHVAVPLAGTGQAVPHPPQLATSLDSLTQAPLQAVNPVPHWSVQLSAAHDALPPPLTGGGHTLAHAPQLSGSVASSTHALPHCTRLAAHPGWHIPATHDTIPPAGGVQT